MHRSGTSALTRVLNLLGFDLPKNLLQPNKANRAGYWESPSVNRLNDELLVAAGTDKWDWRSFSLEKQESLYLTTLEKNALALLEEEFASSRFILLKDPRICRLIWFWRDVLEAFDANPLVVCPIRNPLEVATSLQKRNGIDPAHAYLLWMRYVLDAEAYSRNMPRSFVSYDALLTAWQPVVQRLESDLGLAWPEQTKSKTAEIKRFLSDRYRHERRDADAVMTADGLPEWLRKVFTIFSRWAEAGEDRNDFNELDQIRTEFNDSTLAFRALFPQRTDTNSNVRKLMLRLARTEADSAQIGRKLFEREQELKELNAEHRRTVNRLIRQDLRIGALSAQVEGTRKSLVEAQAKLSTARLGLKNSEAKRAELELELFELEGIRATWIWRFSQSMSQLSQMARGLSGWVLRDRAVEKSVTLVNGSAFFDSNWYLTQYPDVAGSGMEPARHYLLYGAAEGRDPGPLFSTRAYLETHEDIGDAGLNPLVHYLVFGQNEGRLIASSPQAGSESAIATIFEKQNGAAAIPGQNEPDSVPPPLSFPLPPSEEKSWVRHKDLLLDGKAGLTIGETLIATAPPEMDGKEALAEATRAIQFFCRLMSKDMHEVRLGGDLITFEAEDEKSTAPILRLSPDCPPIVDLWFINDHVLRVRFGQAATEEGELRVVRLFQSGLLHETSPILVAESALNREGLTIFDATLVNPYLPVLLIESKADGRLISASLLPFPSLCRAGTHYGELCALATEESYLDKLKSLSGALLSELFADPADAGHLRVARIEVDLLGAIGIERIFSRPILEWLAGVMRIKVAPANAPAVKPDMVREYLEASLDHSFSPEAAGQNGNLGDRVRNGALALTLPADSVPTLNCLVSRSLDIPAANSRALGSFVFAEATTGDPKWVVTVPPMQDELLRGQPIATTIAYPVLTRLRKNDGLGKNTVDARSVVSLRFGDAHGRSEAQLLMPLAPDAPGTILRAESQPSTRTTARISVILPSRDNASDTFPAFLESLRLQTVADELEILANATNSKESEFLKALLKAHFAGRFRVVERNGELGPALNIAGAHAIGEFLLFCTSDAIFYDPRTLETLQLLADHERVASASCLQVQEIPSKARGSKMAYRRGGILPSALARPANASWRFSEPDCHMIFPCATYPVAANSASLFMVRADVWNKLGGFRIDGGPDRFGEIEYGVRAISQGYFNVCTSAIAMGVDGAARGATYRDISLPGAEGDLNLADLASASCVIEALKG
jgi:GT2 family glycosyltransferase